MYLDPGFGSMVIQIVIAGIAACSVFFLSFRTRIKDWFARRKGKQEETTTETSTADAENAKEDRD